VEHETQRKKPKRGGTFSQIMLYGNHVPLYNVKVVSAFLALYFDSLLVSATEVAESQ